MQKTYKICVIGGEKTGKTTFIHRLCWGRYSKEYTPTVGCEVHPVQIKGESGDFSFNVWDTAGCMEFRGLVDGYYILSDGFIIFASTEEQTIEFLDEIPKGVPTVLVLPKIDEKKENLYIIQNILIFQLYIIIFFFNLFQFSFDLFN